MSYELVFLPGDGIGPEVTEAAIKLLETAAGAFSFDVNIQRHLIGGAAFDKTGSPLPDSTLAACQQADAVFLGAIGGPKWDSLPAESRPEKGLLALRSALGVYANIRPLQVYPQLLDASPLKPERLEGVDFVVVRELTGGIYFGEKHRGENFASDQCRYTIGEIERITRVACQHAMQRRRHVTSVDKANVLETSRLWREVVSRVVDEEFPDITLHHQLVDSCAMKLVQSPADFDVILTENMFGDILSDEASVLAGSMGLLASSSLGDSSGLFEPIHGSAPDIAGQGIANPFAAILSVAMMLRWLGELDAANAIEAALNEAIAQNMVTPDLKPGSRVTTNDAAQAVARFICN